jgi:restriction endonuclease Mrr
MDKMFLNVVAILVFIILALGCYFIFRFIYRYSLKVKAENLERSRQEIIQREKEIIQQYTKTKNNYFNLLAKLKNDTTNTNLKNYTLEAGQQLVEFTRHHTEYESVILYDEDNLMNDIPGRTDSLFVEACLLAMSLEHINTYLLKHHLRTDRETAETILNAMVQERFIGEEKGITRPFLISSTRRLEQRINEAKEKEKLEQRINEEKEKKENELFQTDLLRLSNSSEYKYIDQFVKKYGRNISVGELAKLQDLLSIKGFEFSDKQITNIVNLALNRQRYRDAKSKILNEEANSVQDIVKTYLDFDQSEYGEMFEVLKEILEEKGFYDLYENNPEKLREEVEKIKKEIELEIFEKRLLEDDQGIHLEAVDQLDGYDFEGFLTNLYTKMGYNVEQTKLSGDQGADLVVVKFGEKSVIQAKRYGTKVGNYAVQEIVAAISLYKAQKGMVVTNNYFTSAAIELAKANNIELIDRDALEKLINKHW